MRTGHSDPVGIMNVVKKESSQDRNALGHANIKFIPSVFELKSISAGLSFTVRVLKGLCVTKY